ncbi:MAG: hypothetical protein JNL57_13200 [Bacteroidetes bacterium]|nr:hypothetical protein [Bacteroidota bacterium]
MRIQVAVLALTLAGVTACKKELSHVVNSTTPTDALKTEKTPQAQVLFLNSWLYGSEGRRILRVKVANNENRVRRIKAEMYCEDIRFSYSSAWGKPLNDNTIAAAMDFKAVGTDNDGNDYMDIVLPIEKGDIVGAWVQGSITLLDEKGSQLGKTLSIAEQATVLDFDKKEDPEVNGIKFVSYDKGSTWNLIIAVDNFGGGLDSVTFQFDKESRNFYGKKGGGKVTKIVVSSGGLDYNAYRQTYTASGLVFEKDPTGQILGGNVYLFGTGTRTTATQANSKAELL